MTVGSARSAREPAAEANRGPIQQMFRAIDAADFDALEQVFHPGVVVYERGGYAPTTLTLDLLMKAVTKQAKIRMVWRPMRTTHFI